MRILVIGSGAREHALAWKLGQEPGVDYLLCAPGNPGIATSTAIAPLDIVDTDAVVRLIEHHRIDLTVVGPEAPLGRGLADRLAAEGRLVFGPTRAAAQLETSKAFAKDFMQRHRVPTAHYRVCVTAEEALSAIRSGEFGEALVVKADGLAGGKGVVVAPDRATAEAAVNAAMVDRSFGEAGARVVLEEMLTGPEVSFFVVADGGHYVPLLSAQDHKRIFDHDEGPNTGGMGAFSPSMLMTAAAEGRLREFESWTPDPESRQVAVGVVLAAHGYPGDVRSGDVITGLGDVQRDCPGVMVFHAGVKQRGADLVTAGGRVLTVVATAPSFEIAIARAYEAASKIHFDGMQFRRDIGQKALS